MKKLAFAALLALASCTNNCMNASDCALACRPWGVAKFQPGTTSERATCECNHVTICTDRQPTDLHPHVENEVK